MGVTTQFKGRSPIYIRKIYIRRRGRPLIKYRKKRETHVEETSKRKQWRGH
ncbi:hypothetical protein HanIR_Chr03g0110451 [Helianthus annuus]|nr:hypothetical protein HanIR_Chr03g0110451 [Helianthus annuus]